MQWGLILTGFILGLLLGFMIKSVLGRGQQARQQDQELAQAKLDLSQYKQEVADTLDEQFKQLSSLTEQINSMNQKWNAASQILLPEGEKQLNLIDESDLSNKQ